MGDSSKAPVWDEERLRAASDAAGVGLWSWNVDTNEVGMDQRGHALWGVPWSDPLTLEALSSRIHPPDLLKVQTVLEATRSKPGPYEVAFRILRGDEIRWIAARGLGADEGIVGRAMLGIFLDVTERRQAEEARDLLAGEMSHRVKNLFTIASGLTAISARSATTTTEMARDLTQRLTTLGRAHDLIRPDPERAGYRAASLGELLGVFLAPYDERGVIGDRIHVTVPAVSVSETAATTLALVVHELATNSVKYGALSVAGGTLDVSCADSDDEVFILWTERGGPPVTAPTGPGGFGSKLITRSLSGALGGSIGFTWPLEGAAITLRMSKARLAL